MGRARKRRGGGGDTGNSPRTAPLSSPDGDAEKQQQQQQQEEEDQEAERTVVVQEEEQEEGFADACGEGKGEEAGLTRGRVVMEVLHLCVFGALQGALYQWLGAPPVPFLPALGPVLALRPGQAGNADADVLWYRTVEFVLAMTAVYFVVRAGAAVIGKWVPERYGLRTLASFGALALGGAGLLAVGGSEALWNTAEIYLGGFLPAFVRQNQDHFANQFELGKRVAILLLTISLVVSVPLFVFSFVMAAVRFVIRSIWNAIFRPTTTQPVTR